MSGLSLHVRQLSTVIHIWFPYLVSAPGGIQAFSKSFIEATTEVFPEADILVLSNNDPAAPGWLHRAGNLRFSCTGWWMPRQRTAAYATELLTYGRQEKARAVRSTQV